MGESHQNHLSAEELKKQQSSDHLVPEEKSQEKKNHPTSSRLYYTYKFTSIVFGVLLVLAVAMMIFFGHRDAKELSRQVAQLTMRVEAVETQRLVPEDGVTDVVDKQGEGPVLAVPPVEGTGLSTVQEAVTYLNLQYDTFVDQINFLFIVITIAAGFITLIVPILNYAFVQKDHIERVEKLSDCMSTQVEKMNVEFYGQKREYEKNEREFSLLNKKIKKTRKQANDKLGDMEETFKKQEEQYDKSMLEFAALTKNMKGQEKSFKERFAEHDKQMEETFTKQKTQYNESKREFDHLNQKMKELEESFKKRFAKLEEQYEAISTAMLEPDDKKSGNIPPISKKSEDQAWALYMDALVSIRKKAYPQAIKLLTKVIKLEPKNPRFYDMRGYVFYSMKRYAEALEDATKAIELEPENAKYYHSHGATLHAMKRYTEALEDTTKAIELEPENARCYNLRGATLHAMKRYAEALEDTTKAIELEPENARYYNSRGATLYEMKRYAEALEDAAKAIELEPENGLYYQGRSVLCRKLKRYKEALKNAAKAVSLEPDNVTCMATLARCYIQGNDFPKAQTLIKKALSLDSTNSYTFRVRAQYNLALARQGRPHATDKEMLADFDRAITDDPENQYNYICRAEFYLFTKQYEKAKQDLDKALELDPLEPEFYHLYGDVYQAEKNRQKAAEYYKLADDHGYIPEPEEGQ